MKQNLIDGDISLTLKYFLQISHELSVKFILFCYTIMDPTHWSICLICSCWPAGPAQSLPAFYGRRKKNKHGNMAAWLSIILIQFYVFIIRQIAYVILHFRIQFNSLANIDLSVREGAFQSVCASIKRQLNFATFIWQ